MSFQVFTRGVHELQLALLDAHMKVDPVLGKALGAAAEPVKADARGRAAPFSARTASGVRIRRKGVFIRVEQGMRKTTGAHPQYGGFQQRHFFDPALAANQDKVIASAQEVMDDITARVNAMP